MENYVEAGKIAREAREYGKKLVKENVKLLDIAEKIEEKIRELKGTCAFPVDVSVNEIAAHYSPRLNEETKLKKGDLVKLDIGVHVDGYVVDTACTVEVGSENNKKLIEASEKALEEAIKILKVGLEVNKIGKKIQEVIGSYGFSPIKNLSGHSVGKYMIHAGLTIPNFDNGNKTKLKKGDVIAVEPFATDGVGKVIDGKSCGVYRLMEKRSVRDNNARKILEFIDKEYKTLPFTERWLVKKFGLFQVRTGLRFLEKDGIIKEYKLLPEESKGMVSQAEKTVLIDNEIKVLT